MLCTQCGHKNPEGAHFCANCGAALVTTPDDSTTISLAARDLEAEVEEGRRAGRGPAREHRHADGPARAQRRQPLPARQGDGHRRPSPRATSSSTTSPVSRRHAEIRRGANGFTVHDVGSLNGTYLNRERVEDGELVAGDELQIGKFKLVFFAGSRPGGGG